MTRESILAALTVLAFLMSLASWVRVLLGTRRRITVRLYQYIRNQDCHIFYLGVNNLSALAVSVTQLDLTLGGRAYGCTAVPTMVRETIYKNEGSVTGSQVLHSVELPFTLPAHGCKSGYFVFEHCPVSLAGRPAAVPLLLHTSRGAPLEVTLALDGPPAGPA